MKHGIGAIEVEATVRGRRMEWTTWRLGSKPPLPLVVLHVDRVLSGPGDTFDRLVCAGRRPRTPLGG